MKAWLLVVAALAAASATTFVEPEYVDHLHLETVPATPMTEITGLELAQDETMPPREMRFRQIVTSSGRMSALAPPAGVVPYAEEPELRNNQRNFVFAELEDGLHLSGSESSSSESGSSESGSSESGSVAAAAPPAGTFLVPGPWFGSFTARMDTGYNLPAFNFDPTKPLQLGPYRALMNVYSDGETYPLNMQKYDYYGGANGAGGANGKQK